MTWTIFKVFIECVTPLLLFYVFFFGPEPCGILVPKPGVEPAPPALEGRVLTTEWPLDGQGGPQILLFDILFQKVVIKGYFKFFFFFFWESSSLLKNYRRIQVGPAGNVNSTRGV